MSFDEFLKMPAPFPTLPTIREGILDSSCQSQVRMAFTVVDTNGNGYISSAELRRLGKVFIQEDTDEISDLIDSTVGVLDKDDDGQFDFDGKYRRNFLLRWIIELLVMLILLGYRIRRCSEDCTRLIIRLRTNTLIHVDNLKPFLLLSRLLSPFLFT